MPQFLLPVGSLDKCFLTRYLRKSITLNNSESMSNRNQSGKVIISIKINQTVGTLEIQENLDRKLPFKYNDNFEKCYL